jgi:hypothetical protein
MGKKMILIKAVFVGENSLGYIKGRTYILQLKKNGMEVKRVDGSGECVYGSIFSFLNNWDKISKEF